MRKRHFIGGKNWGPWRGIGGGVRWGMRAAIGDKNSVNMLEMSLAGITLALEETMKHIIGSVCDDGWRPGPSVSPLSPPPPPPVGTNHLGPAPLNTWANVTNGSIANVWLAWWSLNRLLLTSSSSSSRLWSPPFHTQQQPITSVPSTSRRLLLLPSLPAYTFSDDVSLTLPSGALLNQLSARSHEPQPEEWWTSSRLRSDSFASFVLTYITFFSLQSSFLAGHRRLPWGPSAGPKSH